MCNVYSEVTANLNAAIEQACTEQPSQMKLAAENGLDWERFLVEESYRRMMRLVTDKLSDDDLMMLASDGVTNAEVQAMIQTRIGQ